MTTNSRPLAASDIAAAFSVASPIHAGLGWDNTNYPLAPSVRLLAGSSMRVGDAGITAEALFDRFSTARSAPGATYYVTAGNVDGNNGTTPQTAVGSIWKAVQLANAGGVPAKILVSPGTYARAANPSQGGAVTPTVDIALIANGGRVVTGTFDQFANPSLDVTNTNAYSWALTNVDRVVDLTRRNHFGNYVELTYVATAAICNATPNSWALVSGTIYIRRHDGTAVTNANTRVYRSNVQQVIRLSGAQTSLYVEGFDSEGGFSGLGTAFNAKPASRKAIVTKNCSFNYAGYVVSTTANGVSVNGLHGIAAFFNTSAHAAAADGFNFHNDIAIGATTHFLLVNCSGYDTGRGSSQSCNGLTSHEDCIGIDIGGDYRSGRGGTVRNIHTSRQGLIGTRVSGDIGDALVGGSSSPVAIQFDNTAKCWADMVEVDMPAGSIAWRALTGTEVYRRNCYSRQPDQGAGTFGAY